MRLLFDQNLSHRLCANLADCFSESAHVRELGLAEADDRAIWEFAGTHEFTVVSLDSDFADMAAFHGPPPKVIWLRAGNRSTASVANMLRKHAGQILDFVRDPDSACMEIY